MGAPSICCNHGICVGTTLLLGRSLLPSLLPSEVFHQPLGCVWGCRCHLCLRGSGRARRGHRAMMLSDRSPGCTCPAGQKRVNSDLPPSQKLFVCPVGGWGAAPIQAGDRSRDGVPLAAACGHCPELQVQPSARAKAAPLDGKNTRGGNSSLPGLAFLIAMTLMPTQPMECTQPWCLHLPLDLLIPTAPWRGPGCETPSCTQHFTPTAPQASLGVLHGPPCSGVGGDCGGARCSMQCWW